MWAIQSPGGSGNSIALDNLGDVYVTGSFIGTTDFDPAPTSAAIDSSAGMEIFLFLN